MTLFIDCSVRVTAILTAAFLISWLLRRQSAALRHLVWTAAFAVALATPLLLRWTPPTVAPVSLPIVVQIDAVATTSAPRTPARKPKQFPYGEAAIAIWAAGVLVCAVRMVRGAMLANTLRRAAKPVDVAAEIPANVAIAESDSAAVAMTVGVFAPLILLPAHHRDWPLSRLRSVLLHELAHVRRNDCLLQWLPQTVCALHWFNPLGWLARAQMLCESERACDDAVIQDGASGPDFARDLLAIAESSGLKGADPMLVTIATRLERRIARLLDASANRQPLSRAHALGTAAAVLALLLPIAAVRAQAPGAQTGTLSGVVIDPVGAVIANATVNLSGPGGKLAVAANPAGAWTAGNLAPGQYQIEVSVPGFIALRQIANVNAGETTQLKQPMVIGQIAERVTVVGTKPSGAATTAPAAPAQRIRVGGNIQAAKLISRTAPVYPDSARLQGLEATVLIQAIIGKTGSILDAHVLGNNTPPDLSQAALDAVRTWQYEPTRLNGEPVEVMTTITVNFQLQ